MIYLTIHIQRVVNDKSITTNNRGLLLIMQAKPRLKTDNDFRRLRSCEEKDLALFNVGF